MSLPVFCRPCSSSTWSVASASAWSCLLNCSSPPIPLMLRTVPLFCSLSWIVIVPGLRFGSTVQALATACLGGIIFCLGEVMLGIFQPVVAAQLAGPRFCGRMFGLLNTAGSMGYILSPLVSYFVLDGHQAHTAPVHGSIGLVLLAFPWFLTIKTDGKPSKTKQEETSTAQAAEQADRICRMLSADQ